MEQENLAAQFRTEKGKGAARRLRRQGLIPAVVYGQREDPIPVSLNPQQLTKIMRYGARGRSLINLTIDGLGDGPINTTVILKDRQMNPLKQTIMHVDLYRVVMDEEISVSVPVHTVGTAIGVEKGGILDQLLREIEVRCLPGDIPPEIEVDVSSLDIGDAIHVESIQLKKATILTDLEPAIVTVAPPTVLEEPVAEEEVEEEEEVEAAEETAEEQE